MGAETRRRGLSFVAAAGGPHSIPLDQIVLTPDPSSRSHGGPSRMLELLTAFLAPAAAIMLALPFGMHFRGSSDDRQVRAVYLFHRSGEPVATVASDRLPPFAPDQIPPIIGTARDFVKPSGPPSPGPEIMRQRI